ncbi:hypothetical protein I3760_14G044300 [Carya illinoinensis]|nr:hypothetical protein I3760_14G044300 [Carya illinoinensis]
MASPPSSASAFLLLSLSALFVISPVHSLTCTSQIITNNAVYKQCLDLPRLSSYLHWTYDQSNFSLSIAFIAPPPKSDGWIAWAINPTGTGMKGAQTLLAFKSDGGGMTVKTYNIEEIGPITESKISFEVWDLSAESDGGVMRLFAKVKVPGNAQTVNQVCQVGPSITAGLPDQHELQMANLNAKSTLSLVGEQMASPSGGDSRIKKKNIHGILNVVN